MLRKRFSRAAAELGGAIYAVGGYTGADYTREVERLDPRVGRWEAVARMRRGRGAHACAVLQGKIFSLGGYDADATGGGEVGGAGIGFIADGEGAGVRGGGSRAVTEGKGAY